MRVKSALANVTPQIRGRYDRKLQRYISSISDINGGAQIRQIFNEFLFDYHLESITCGMEDKDIDRAIRMHEGDSLPGFGGSESFEFLLRPHLRKVKLPAGECVNDVATTLDNICQKIAKSVFRRFPKLAEIVLQKTQDICFSEKQKALDVVDHMVQSEISYTNLIVVLALSSGQEFFFRWQHRNHSFNYFFLPPIHRYRFTNDDEFLEKKIASNHIVILELTDHELFLLF